MDMNLDRDQVIIPPYKGEKTHCALPSAPRGFIHGDRSKSHIRKHGGQQSKLTLARQFAHANVRSLIQTFRAKGHDLRHRFVLSWRKQTAFAASGPHP